MENEATTKTPIPTESGFPNFALCTCLHPDPLGIRLPYSVFRLLSSVSCPLSPAFCLNHPSYPTCHEQTGFLSYISPMYNSSVFSVTSVALSLLCKTNPISKWVI
jgi:hypothetical protein